MFLLVFILAGLAMAQDSRVLSLVKGTVVADDPLAGNHLVADLFDSISHKQFSRSYVGADGHFEFRNVPAGIYSVEIGASTGDPIQRKTVSLNGAGDEIEIRLPAHEKNAPGGTVSVRQLQHPPSAKSIRSFDAAQKASARGDYIKAIEILRGALRDPSAMPYARMNIGVAYLRAGQAEAAVPELEQAARLLPEDAVARTNLAYSLLLAKRFDEAEPECRQALLLDRNSAKARWVLASILLAQGAHDEEAIENLRLASRELPKAKVALARFYERKGETAAAARELREFLPQATGADKATVERWLSKLTAK